MGRQAKLRQDQIGLEALNRGNGRDQITRRVGLDLASPQDAAQSCAFAARGLDDEHPAREVGRIQIGAKPHVVISPKSWKTKGERDLTTGRGMALLVSREFNAVLVLVTDVLQQQHRGESPGGDRENVS